MKSKTLGFEIKTLTLDARQSLGSLCGYLGSSGLKLSTIKTKEEFWAILEKIYAFKIDYKFDVSTALNVACMYISGLSKSERRRRVRQHKTGSHLSEAKRIMAKLHKENDEFLARKKTAIPSKADKDAFYASWEWRTLRMEVLRENGAVCMCCGSTPAYKDMNGNPTRIVVDHIKPIHHYWPWRLKKDNLQVLCDECNQGKGAWDETDHRPKPAPDEWLVEDEMPELISDQLRIRH